MCTTHGATSDKQLKSSCSFNLTAAGPLVLVGMQIISSYLGSVTAIAQEHGSTLTNATVLVGAPSQDNTTARANASGIIRCVHCLLCRHAAPVHAEQLKTFAAAVSTTWQSGLHGLPAQCMQDAGLPVSPRGASCVIPLTACMMWCLQATLRCRGVHLDIHHHWSPGSAAAWCA